MAGFFSRLLGKSDDLQSVLAKMQFIPIKPGSGYENFEMSKFTVSEDDWKAVTGKNIEDKKFWSRNAAERLINLINAFLDCLNTTQSEHTYRHHKKEDAEYAKLSGAALEAAKKGNMGFYLVRVPRLVKPEKNAEKTRPAPVPKENKPAAKITGQKIQEAASTQGKKTTEKKSGSRIVKETKASKAVPGKVKETKKVVPKHPKPSAPSKVKEETPAKTQKLKAVAKLGGKFYANPLGMEFILCPAGTFMRGGTRIWRSKSGVPIVGDTPAHQVTLTRPFYIGKYPVTRGQWVAVLGELPFFKVSPHIYKDSTYPENDVLWSDALQFTEKLNALEGVNHYRLPTEAEWEYAARAGTTTEFFWGDDERKLTEYAWFEGNSDGKVHPVGQKKANPWGLHDIYGNVWEWAQDWHWRYSSVGAPYIDPCGPDSGEKHVCRGGSYSDETCQCRSAARMPILTSLQNGFRGHYGFRLAFSLE